MKNNKLELSVKTPLLIAIFGALAFVTIQSIRINKCSNIIKDGFPEEGTPDEQGKFIWDQHNCIEDQVMADTSNNTIEFNIKRFPLSKKITKKVSQEYMDGLVS